MKYILSNWKSILPVVAVSIVFALFFTSNNTRLKGKISELQGANKVLKQLNDSLAKQRGDLEAQLAAFDTQIAVLTQKDDSLSKQVSALKDKLTKTNKKYEKANTHANNYTTDSIRSYFSDFE
jgi:peptidoglycan hydrolase CwlO-like protein